MIRQVFLLFSIVLLIQNIHTQTSSYSFQRILECVTHINETCLKWNENTVLVENKTSSFSCFPGNTYLLTPQGPKTMRRLRIGDKVWSLNLQTNQETFSTIIGWLHRDELADSKFQRINTIDGLYFFSSSSHNIGVLDQGGQYTFKFANQLTPGERIVLDESQSSVVQSVEESDWQRGLFSPFTEHKTFYIFHSAFQPDSFNTIDEPMMLAHALSQIRNPQEVSYLFKSVIYFSYMMNMNSQPKSTQKYVHPIISNFKFMFKDWYSEHTIVRYNIPSSLSRGRTISKTQSIMDDSAGLKQEDTTNTTTTEEDTSSITKMIILNGILLQITLIL